MNYEKCKTCGVVRNIKIAPDCPICKFDDAPITKFIQKEWIDESTKEEVRQLQEMRKALAENVKNLWRVSSTWNKYQEFEEWRTKQITRTAKYSQKK